LTAFTPTRAFCASERTAAGRLRAIGSDPDTGRGDDAILLAVATSTTKRARRREPGQIDLRALIAAADTIQGRDFAELDRAQLVRQGFMRALIADPPIAAALRAMASGGVKAVALETAAAGVELAELGHLAGPHVLIEELFSGAERSAALTKLEAEHPEPFARWWAAVGLLDEILDSDQISRQMLTLVVFVLEIRWPWVARALTRHYLLTWMATAAQLNVEILSHVRLDGGPARRFSFRTGETPEGMLARLRGRRPRSKGHRGRLAEYGEWFYRHHVRHEPWRALAKEYTSQRGVAQSDDRRQIKYGVELAARLLPGSEPALKMRRPPTSREAARINGLREKLIALRTPPGELVTPR
jgi:hypothetical protein